MSRLAIFTRGRTGSSAIREELNNHPAIECHGEIFRPNPFAWPGVEAAFKEFGKDYPQSGKSRDKILPFRLHADLGPEDPVTPEAFRAYWEFLDASIAGKDATVIGAKILTNHVPVPAFFQMGAENDIFALVLRRRNGLRQNISAQVARKTGVHNRVDYTPEEGRRFTIEPEKVIARVLRNRTHDAAHDAALQESGMRHLVVYYEDWVADRAAFFRPVFESLGLEYHLPEGTTFSRTTPEPLSDLLENYDEFAKAVEAAGLAEMLE